MPSRSGARGEGSESEMSLCTLVQDSFLPPPSLLCCSAEEEEGEHDSCRWRSCEVLGSLTLPRALAITHVAAVADTRAMCPRIHSVSAQWRELPPLPLRRKSLSFPSHACRSVANTAGARQASSITMGGCLLPDQICRRWLRSHSHVCTPCWCHRQHVLDACYHGTGRHAADTDG